MKSDKHRMRIALVHDYLKWHGGAERVLEALHEIWPEAPIYTSVYDPESMPDEYRRWDIRTTFMQKLPFVSKLLKHYSFLYSLAFEQFDFAEYDVVISSSAGFAKGIITRPETLHISYIHTPPRFQWGYETSIRAKLGPIYRNIILPPIDNYLRMWDQCAAERVDLMIANSREVQKRIHKIYRRDSIVVNPPVDTERFMNVREEKGNYFVTVSRLERYKQIDKIIRVCNKHKLNLKVVGTGAEEEYLRSIAGPTVEICGRLSDEVVAKTLVGAKAFVFMTEEDFGIVMAEAQAAGVPIIAYSKGGASEIVTQRSGVLFDLQTEEALEKVLLSFDPSDYRKEDCMENAQRFSKSSFQDKIRTIVNDNLN